MPSSTIDFPKNEGYAIFPLIVFLYRCLILPLSRLPLVLLYRLSSFFFYVVYYIVPYRKKVVFENLRGAFPLLTEQEHEKIAKDFYRHFCDLIFESIKGFHISKDEITKRHVYTNIELLERYSSSGKGVTILGSHYGNWEWVALSLPLACSFQTHGIYQTLNNAAMNALIKTSRQRYGMALIPTEDVASTMEKSQGQKITMGYIADQSPARTGRHYWLTFLNQPTAALSGFEFFAKKYNTPVLYLNVVKKKRGFYECVFHLICEEPQKTKDGEIVETYMKTLEKIIEEKPEYWLWTHRRWKIKPAEKPTSPQKT